MLNIINIDMYRMHFQYKSHNFLEKSFNNIYLFIYFIINYLKKIISCCLKQESFNSIYQTLFFIDEIYCNLLKPFSNLNLQYVNFQCIIF